MQLLKTEGFVALFRLKKTKSLGKIYTQNATETEENLYNIQVFFLFLFLVNTMGMGYGSL